MVLQALSATAVISSTNLSLILLLGWDFGSRSRLDTLYIDAAWLLGPFSVVKNCSELQPLLELMMGGGDYDASAGDLADLLKNCADTLIKKMPCTTEIDDELYCISAQNTVRTSLACSMLRCLPSTHHRSVCTCLGISVCRGTQTFGLKGSRTRSSLLLMNECTLEISCCIQ